MMPSIALLFSLFVAFLIGMFTSRRLGSGTDAKLIDITARIKANQDKLDAQKEKSDAAVEAYRNALANLNKPDKPS